MTYRQAEDQSHIKASNNKSTSVIAEKDSNSRIFGIKKKRSVWLTPPANLTGSLIYHFSGYLSSLLTKCRAGLECRILP